LPRRQRLRERDFVADDDAQAGAFVVDGIGQFAQGDLQRDEQEQAGRHA